MVQQPYLDAKAVREVLEALRQAVPLDDHLLGDFLIVREQLQTPEAIAGEVAAAQVIYTMLVERITASLERLRTVEEIENVAGADIGRAAAEVALIADFGTDNVELEAWSVLYHRYVRVDLDWQVQDIARLVSQVVRTVRRRLMHGISRLTEQLVVEERAARAKQARQRMRLALPVAVPPELVGMDEILAGSRAKLAETGAAMMLHGSGGLGKTAVAVNLAHSLVDAEAIEDVVWLYAPTFEALPARLLEGAGVAEVSDPVMALRAHIQIYRLLIVLDGAEALMSDPIALGDLLAVLSGARVLITSRVAPPPTVPVRLVTLHELDKPAAWALMEREFERLHGRPPDTTRRDAQLTRVWSFAGGNPLALRVAVGHLRFFDAGRVIDRLGMLPVGEVGLFDVLYRAAWDALDDDARRLWLALLLFPSSAAAGCAAHIDDLEALISVAPCDLESALVRLVDRALIDTVSVDGEPRYVLSRLARGFLLSCLAEQPARARVAAYACAVAERLPAPRDNFEYVFTRGAHLLSSAAHFGLDSEMVLQLAGVVHECAVGLGRWADWLPVLRKLAEFAGGPRESARLLVWQGETARHLGRLDEATDWLLGAVHRATRAGLADVRASGLLELAAAYRLGGRPGAARTAELARRDFAALGDAEGEARAVAELAQIELDAKRPAAALQLLESVPAPENQRARWEALRGNVYLYQAEFEAALAAHRRALSLAGRENQAQRLNRARALVNLGRVQLEMGALDEAESSFIQALDGMTRTRDALGRIRARANLAVLYAERGHHRRAIDLLKSVLREQEAFGDRRGMEVSRRNLAETRLRAAEAALDHGQLKAAVRHLDAGYTLYDALGMDVQAEAAAKLLSELRAAPRT